MVERLKPIESYKSPLKINPCTKEFADIETFEGTVSNVISSIESGIERFTIGSQDEKDSQTLFYRTYELIKMTIEEKVVIDRQKKGYTNVAIGAINLAFNLAIACDLQDNSAKDLLLEFKDLVDKTELKSMLNRPLKEAPDPGIMPDDAVKEDLEIANNLLAKAKGKDILMIVVGYRGLRRALDIFLDLKSENNKIWGLRYSPKLGDKFTNISWQEIEMLRKWSENRQIVVVGPEDRLKPAVAHLLRIGLVSWENGKPKQNIIGVPLHVVKQTDNGEAFSPIKRKKILNKISH